MIIECELLSQVRVVFLNSIWAHSPIDPLAVRVKFEGSGAVWDLSLSLLMEAFTSSTEELQGYGDVLVEVSENFSIIHLTNGRTSASLKFSTADIQEFLNQVDLQDSEEVIARELDEFLGAL